MIPFDTLIWLSAGCLLAYFLKAFSGFGSALVFVPVVTLLFDATTALAASALVDLFVGLAMVLVLTYERRDARILVEMCIAIMVGTAIGSVLAGAVSARLIQLLIGAAVLWLGARLLVRHGPEPSETSHRSGWFLSTMCFVGGITGGLIGISGPPIVGAAKPVMDKSAFRRRMAMIFFVQSPVKLVVYPLNGVWTEWVWPVSLACAIPIVVGMAIGFRAHWKVSERMFSVVVGVILIVLAARVLWGVM